MIDVIDKYNSKKIAVLQFFLILLVLYIHGFYPEAGSYSVACGIQRVISGHGLCIVANPLFFTLSGLLFFKGVKTRKNVYIKIKRRARTLLIPYVLWNIVFVGWYLFMSYIPITKPFVNSDILGKLSGGLLPAFNALFVDPINFPLWFLRDLILIVLLSPLIYEIIIRMKWWGLAVVFAVIIFYHIDGLFYFTLGGAISILGSFESINNFVKNWIWCICGMLYIGNAALFYFLPLDYSNPWIMNFLISLFSIAFIWRTYDYVYSRINKGRIVPIINKLPGYSFFIFCFHEPVYNIVKKIPIYFLGTNQVLIIFLFIINPVIMAFLSVFTAKVLKLVCPSVYNVLVGSR